MKKTILDRNRKPITKGTIVRYGDGWCRVTGVVNPFMGLVNLGAIFGGKVYHKRVSVNGAPGCFEDEAAWYKDWQQSETYQSM